MKLGRRKRERVGPDDAREDVEQVAAALAEALSTLEAERRLRAELERALEDERDRKRSALDDERRRKARPALDAQRTRKPPRPRVAQTARAEKERRWKMARQLAAEGHSQREIARRLGINRRTVARLVAADEPPRYRRAPQGSMLDPLEPVMRSVLREKPAISAPGMTALLRTHGYRGSVDLVRRRLRRLRPPA
jgi:transposase